MKNSAIHPKMIRNLLFGFGLLVCLLLAAAGLSSGFKTAQAQQQASDLITRKMAGGRTAADLMKEARTAGSVRVIVGLRAGYRLEGGMSSAAVVAQRLTIAQTQTAVLNRLSAHRVTGVKRFGFIPFLAIEVDAGGLEQLRQAPEVTTIEEDAMLRATLAESVRLIGAPAAWAGGFAGAGQAVAILDSGVDKAHAFLANKVVSEACYSTTGSGTTSVCPDGVSQSTSAGSGVNCSAPGCEHGTHVAGIAAGRGTSFSGVAREANIIAIQVFSRINGCSASASDCLTAIKSDVLLGLERVQQLSGNFNIAAVNLSLGGGKYTANCDAVEPSFKMAIDNLRSMNIATVVASGNDGYTGSMGAPACISSAISVGSTGDGGTGATVNVVSNFSDGASFLHLLAPGELINSSIPGGGFTNFRGTSMAAPHVAGAWAVLKSKTPTASVPQVLQALTNTGLPVTDPRNDLIKPRIRVDAAVNALAGTACSYAILPAAQSFTGNGGAAMVNVTATAGCAWTASSNAPWITINSGGNGAGNGPVSYTAAANMGLDREGTLFIAGQTFSVTQTGVPTLAVDDGSFEDGLGVVSAATRYGVNRLTPPSYPAAINRVAIFFPSGFGLTVGANVTILAGTNPSGSADINGIALTSFPATVQALDQFNLYDIPITTIDSGDFVVGFQRTLAAREFPFALDETPPSRQRSYFSSNGTTFTILDNLGFPANFGIRAVPVQGQVVIAGASALTVESCQPANNTPDPNEAVIATLSLRNVGTANITNLVATLQAAGGVTAPGGPQTYGALPAGGPAIAKSFAFTAGGACGGAITATLDLRDGATNLGTAAFTFTLGTPRTSTMENFDGVTAPALPTGWTSAIGSGSPPLWVTSTTASDTAPNNAFATDPSSVSDVRLDSPSIAITSSTAQLSFRNNYDTESQYDGGVLEIAIAAGAFTDIITAGGSFVAGGYNETLSTFGGNPIAGRRAWSGRSSGYIAAIVNLPATAAGRNIRFRWRMTSNSSGGGLGWRIDGIRLIDGNTCATDCSASCLTLGAISPGGQTFAPAGGAGAVNLTLPQNCNWTASTQAPWLTITSGASGSGSGAVNYSVAANTASNARTGTLTIAGRVFTVTQAGCGFAIAPVSRNFDPAGGDGSVAVTAAGGCPWTAASNVPWIAVASGASGSGSGTVNFTVAPNTGTGARTGTLTVAGLTFTVTQAACAYVIAPVNQVFAVAGGAGSVAVTTQGGCAWTATSNVPWITITSGASGSGSGTLDFSVAPGPADSARTGTLRVAGQTVSITQVPYAADVGIAGFDLPASVRVGRPVTIRVRVTNFGSSPQSNFPVSYQINNEFPVTETFAGTLAPLQTAIKSFTALWTPFIPGPYQITARTQLSNDQNRANDAVQASVQAGQAQYRGSWQGTTNTGRPVRFTVDENDVIVSLEVDVPITFFVPPFTTVTCTGTFRNADTATISGGQFEVPLLPFGGVSTSGTPRARGTFSSLGAATGRVDDFSVNLIICGNFLGFGANVTGPTWNVQRQVTCPTVSDINLPSGPASGMVGAPVVITGANFTEVSAVKFANNVTASFIVNDGSRITATVPVGAVTGPITISKPGCPDVQTSPFTVLDSPVPALTALNPNTITAGSPAFTFTLTGTNFSPGSMVRWNGSNRPTAFVSSTQLMAAIPAGDIAAAGTASVTIFNPAPGGGTSSALNFRIAPPCPTIALAPASLPAGTINAAYNQTLTASGGAAPYSFTLSAGTLPNGLALSSGGVLSGTPAQQGSFNITVRATDANGCTGTQSYSLVINCPAITLAPTTLPDGTGGAAYNQTLTASGGAAPYSFAVTAGALPGGLTLSTGGVLSGTPTVAGTANFTITALGLGPCSGRHAYVLIINNPSPSLASLNPNSATAGGAAFKLGVTGSNFINGATVQWNGANRATMFVNATQLSADITAADVATAGVANVTVVNPSPGGGLSSAQPFTINNPQPSVASLSPSLVTMGGAAFTLTLEGMNFVNGSVVRWQGSDRATTHVSSTRLTAEIPAEDIATAGTAAVTVFNPAPGGGVSGPLSLIIREPNKPPQVTSLAPNPVVAGGQNFTLTVNGRDFVAGSTVRWDGAERPTTFVSATQLTAAIPAADIAAAREVKITVFTPEPGGGRSNEMILSIANAVANVSAASFSGATLAPDSIVAAFGVRLATAVKVATTTPLPTELEGTTLRVKDSAGAERLARLFFVAPGQINYLMPPETAAGPATVTVRSGDGIVAVGAVQIAMTAPSLFTANADGKGVAVGVALRVKADGTQVYEPISRFDEGKKMFVPLPIDLGNENEQVFLILNGSGIRNRSSLSAVTVTTGGLSQQALFAGAVEGLAGFDQVNVGPLSRSLMGRGEVDLVLTVEGRPANTARVSIK